MRMSSKKNLPKPELSPFYVAQVDRIKLECIKFFGDVSSSTYMCGGPYLHVLKENS